MSINRTIRIAYSTMTTGASEGLITVVGGEPISSVTLVSCSGCADADERARKDYARALDLEQRLLQAQAECVRLAAEVRKRDRIVEDMETVERLKALADLTEPGDSMPGLYVWPEGKGYRFLVKRGRYAMDTYDGPTAAEAIQAALEAARQPVEAPAQEECDPPWRGGNR